MYFQTETISRIQTDKHKIMIFGNEKNTHLYLTAQENIGCSMILLHYR